MQIVDAQIHVWGSGLPSNQAHRQVTAFTTAEAVALMDEGGVDAAVIHPPGWDPGASDMAFAGVRDYPGRFAIMGAFPLDRPDNRGLVATWRQQPGMLGLRYGFLNEPLRGWLADGTLDWLWDAAERAFSVYVPGRVEPMLPDALSSDLCSLRPGFDRRCVTSTER